MTGPANMEGGRNVKLKLRNLIMTIHSRGLPLLGMLFLSMMWQAAYGNDRFFSAKGFDTSLYAGFENFRWQEFDDDGQRLLTEQGPRYVLGASLFNRDRQASGLVYDIDLRAYVGKVDYDGQDSQGIYTSTDSNYQGGRAELTGGYRWQSTYSSVTALDLLLTLGADAWQRDIDDGVNANGFPISGLKEDYVVYFGKAGLGAQWQHTSFSSYLQLGMKKPFSTREKVDVFDVTLSPGKKWSAYASYTLKMGGEGRRSYIAFYYDTYRFSKSSPKSIGSGIVWQPESDMDVAGVSFGYVF
ncbi:MAG TPA: hypothetical protein ENJ22_02560 [Gammaproteobacteria bacterium]|nr:hypothetical protein [Gammaproteobacteria bacterium]